MKKLISTLLAATLAFSLVACGASNAGSTGKDDTAADTSATDAADDTADDAADAAEPAGEGITIRVAASPVPHAEILNVAKEILAEQGITLDIVEFTDYVQPNLVTENGEVEANYFQHGPYLDDFNAENGTHLVSVVAVHYEPMGLYPGKTASIEELADGAQIAVPNDTTNEARALQLLAAQGLITLADGVGLQATVNDIVDNPKNLKIVEQEAAQLPRTLADVDMAVLNGNYAAEAGFSVSEALAAEDAESVGAQTYANLLVVKEGNEEAPGIAELIEALTSDTVRDYITETYDGSVVAIF